MTDATTSDVHPAERLRTDVLCGCGWGRLRILFCEVPEDCPCCGFGFWEAYGDPWFAAELAEEED